MDAVIQAVSTVGFPIVAFFISVWALKYAYDKSMEQADKQLKTIADLTKAVNNNTVVLTQLVEHLEKKEEL